MTPVRVVSTTLATALLLVGLWLWWEWFTAAGSDLATTAAYADPEAQYLECIGNTDSETCQNTLKRQEEEKKPEDILKNTYFRYMAVKSCFERWKGSKQVYINDAEMNKAEQYMSAIDKRLNLPTKDKMWGQNLSYHFC